jgi:hypothetical protein
LAELLGQAMGITRLTPFEQIDLEQYGYSEIAPVQRAWAENFDRIEAEAAVIFREQPSILLSGSHYWDSSDGFIEVIRLREPSGMRRLIFYGDSEVIFNSWKLTLREGYVWLLFSPDGLRVAGAVDIKINEDGTRADAPTWTLEITNEELKIEPHNDTIRIVQR